MTVGPKDRSPAHLQSGKKMDESTSQFWLAISGLVPTSYTMIGMVVFGYFKHPEETKFGVVVLWPLVLLIELYKSAKAFFMYSFQKRE
jgi:hypothetical protein